MKKQWMTALALVALSATVAMAGPRHGHRGSGHGRRGRAEGGGQRFGLARHAGLDLTADQEKKLRAIRETHRAQIEKAADKLREQRRAMHELAMAEPVNEAAVRKAAATLAGSLADMALLRAGVRKQFQSVLTDEQRKKLAECKDCKDCKERHRKGGRMRSRGRGRFGRHQDEAKPK